MKDARRWLVLMLLVAATATGVGTGTAAAASFLGEASQGPLTVSLGAGQTSRIAIAFEMTVQPAEHLFDEAKKTFTVLATEKTSVASTVRYV